MKTPVPMLRRLLLRRFRSLQEADIEFDNPTFMVGRNGSGKSNIADSFHFLSDAMRPPLQAAFDWRGGISAVRNRPVIGHPPNLGIGVVLSGLNGESISARYAFELIPTRNQGFAVAREQCVVDRENNTRDWFDRDSRNGFRSNIETLKPALESDSLALPLVGGDTRFQPVHHFLSKMRAYNIEPSTLRDMQDPDGGAYLRSDGRNAASVLREIKQKSEENWNRILEYLQVIVPKTIAVGPKKHGNKLALEFVQDWGKSKNVKFEGYNMSDGTLRAVGILAAAFQQPTPSVLIIEEPESTIHPGALGAILDVLRHASHFMQVVVTTHSPDILASKWIKGNHLKIVSWEQGETRVGLVSDEMRSALEAHLTDAGELLRTNALEAAPKLFVSSPQQLPLFQEELQ